VAKTGTPKAPLTVTDEQWAALEKGARAATSAQAYALRCRIILGCAEPGDAGGDAEGCDALDGFKLSTDPLFVEKVIDVVGLYHNPPERAVVLCVDEKTQVQALDRSQPVLPMMPGMPERRTHDYARHGTTSLFAAFNVADGTVIGELHRRHRATEYLKFLRAIDKAVPAELDVHVVCDNLSTQKTPAVNEWIARHPRFHIHFTPTGDGTKTAHVGRQYLGRYGKTDNGVVTVTTDHRRNVQRPATAILIALPLLTNPCH
jgi:transposase